jgi:diphthamide synthase (EF-2-diphthine--ammonia ligase)
MSSDVVRAAMSSAVEQAMDEVVSAAMPSVVEQLRSEVGMVRLDEMVRRSVERVVPEVVERELTAAIVTAAALPGRTARGLARLPGSVLRTAALPEGSDE